MKRYALLPLLLAGSCSIRSVPVAPPEDVGGTCSTAQATLARLGGCGVDLATFETDCDEKARLYAEVGDRYPVGCLTASGSCEQAQACR